MCSLQIILWSPKSKYIFRQPMKFILVLTLMRWDEMGGGQMTHRRKLIIKGIILHLKQQKACQGTLGTQVLTYIRFKTSFGPSIDPTDPLKWTLWFLSILQYFKKLLYIFEEEKNLAGWTWKNVQPMWPMITENYQTLWNLSPTWIKISCFSQEKDFFLPGND